MRNRAQTAFVTTSDLWLVHPSSPPASVSVSSAPLFFFERNRKPVCEQGEFW